MDKQDLKKSTCINLRCVTQSSKGGVPLNQLQNDYRLLLGTPVPFKDLGYSSLENFLRDIPDVICLKKNADGSLIAEGVADASTAHIAKLISKQKSSKKSKSGSSKPCVVIRTWGSSGKTNSYQKKVPLRDFNNFPPSPLYRKYEQNSKFMHNTPAQQELKKSVLINLRSVVQSCKDGVPLNRLQKDYWKFIGSNIPFEKLGYSTLYEFIKSIPDVINLKVDANEQFIATGVVDKATAHLFGSPVKPNPSKPPPNEPCVNIRPMPQVTSTSKDESPFFKLPQNTMELPDLNNVLKHSPTKKKPLKVAKLGTGSRENSVSETSLPKTDITSLQNPNKIAKTIQDQIKTASLSPLVWMHFILYGPSKIESLRKEILSFCGFPFSTDSKAWQQKISLLSMLPKETLHQCLYLLRIEFDIKDSKKRLQNKLLNFLATYTEESGTNAKENEQENVKELHASTLTLSSVSSEVLSKWSYYADTETSDAVRSDRGVVPKTKQKIISDSDSDFMSSPTHQQNLLRKNPYFLEGTKEPVQVQPPDDKGNFKVENGKGIQNEKNCKTKKSKSTKSTLVKPSSAEKIISEVQKQKSLNENSVAPKVDPDEDSKVETSSTISSKSARKRRKKKKKPGNLETNI